MAKRLLHYVAAGLLSIEDLRTHIDALESQDPDNVFTNLLQTINDPFELVAELQNLYQESYTNYVQMLKELRQQESEDDLGSSVAERMITAFNALDDDMSNEALSAPSSESKIQNSLFEHLWSYGVKALSRQFFHKIYFDILMFQQVKNLLTYI